MFESAAVYSFNEDSPKIVLSDEEITVKDNRFSFDMEPLAVYMLVFNGEDEIISVSEPEETTSAEVSDIDTEQDTMSETSVSETEASATASVPEHVAADTYSTAGASVSETAVPPAPESSGISESAATEPPEQDSSAEERSYEASAPDESSPSDEIIEKEKKGKTVPKAIKTAVIVLTSAVVLAMAYVIVQDRVLSKKSRK